MKNKFIDLVKGYTESKEGSSGKKFYVSKITGAASGVHITRISKYFTWFFDKLTHLLSYTSTRTYGALLSTMGALSFVLNFVAAYFKLTEEIPLYVILISAALLLVGIPLLIINRQLTDAMQSFAVTDFVFFEFFCIRRVHPDEKERGIHFSIGIVLGALLAFLSFFVPLYIIALVMVGLIYLFLTFLSPEFSFFSIFLAMPYLSFDKDGVFLAGLVLLTLVSYARKVYLGKRVYFFEQYDLMLFIMLLCILISGIFVKGLESFVSSVVMILLAGGYILSSSLVTNRRLADCLVNAVIVSSLPVSAIAITDAAVMISKVGFMGFTGISATFDEPYILAVFMLISGAFTLYFADTVASTGAKVFYTVVFMLNLASLLATMSMWIFCVAIIGIIAYAASKLPHGYGVITVLLCLLPNIMLFVPYDVIRPVLDNPVMSYFGFSSSIERWHTVFLMLRDNLFLGVGIGEECFAEEIVKYAPDFKYADSGSFMLEIACEAGIISLVAFVIILLIRVEHRAIYKPYIKNSQVSSLSRFTSVCCLLFLVYGTFNYVWSDMTMYYLFWCVFGLGSASLRVSKQEFDDRVAYFSDGRAEDSSSIDITIK